MASVLGPRFLDWQIEQSAAESWAECERHAEVLASSASYPPPPTATPPSVGAPSQSPVLPQLMLGFSDDNR